MMFALMLQTHTCLFAKAQDGSGKNVLEGASLTLSDKIEVSFYVRIRDTSFGEFVLDGPSGRKTVAVYTDISQRNTERGDLYKLNYPVSPTQLGERITLSLGSKAVLYKPDGSDTYTNASVSYCASDYIRAVKSGASARPPLRTLADTLENYGKCAVQNKGGDELSKAIGSYTAAANAYKQMADSGRTIDSINVTDSGDGKNYSFVYSGEKFTTQFTIKADGKENWKIIDSYKVRNSGDMQMICQALIDLHPVHGRDMVSFRTAQDMAKEWELHNLAYDYLPEGAQKARAKDVDLDPDDQGKTLTDFIRQIMSGG